MKRITVNFKNVNAETDAEVEDLLKRCRDNGRKYFYDKRNGIYCIEPTFDAICYVNYLDYLNAHYNEWVSYGYFDLGLIPLFMGPSFMQEALMNEIGMIISAWNVPIKPMRACSFLGRSYFGPNDSWIKRTDFEKATGVPADQACMSTFIKSILKKEDIL